MLVKSLSLRNFRSYTSLECSFDPGINIFVGQNGVGKTNVVEAIRYSSVLSSHRVAADAPMIKDGEASAVIRCLVQQHREQQLEVAINSGRANQIQVAGSAVRPRDFVGLLRTVMFGPEDLRIVKGDPSDRREFIDQLLIQRAPRYLSVKADYDRVIKQRTSLLKTTGIAKSSSAREAAQATMQVWDEQLAALGAALTLGRLRMLAELNDPVRQSYRDISNGGEAAIEYEAKSLHDWDGTQTQEAIEKALLLSIEDQHEAEIKRGVTLVGPHRDDIKLSISGLPARTHASHGESWSLALALRLGSFEVLRSIDDSGDPILILDDVFAELDSARRKALSAVAESAEQVFVTAAVAEDVPPFQTSVTFTVSPGEVRRGS